MLNKSENYKIIGIATIFYYRARFIIFYYGLIMQHYK